MDDEEFTTKKKHIFWWGNYIIHLVATRIEQKKVLGYSLKFFFNAGFATKGLIFVATFGAGC